MLIQHLKDCFKYKRYVLQYLVTIVLIRHCHRENSKTTVILSCGERKRIKQVRMQGRADPSRRLSRGTIKVHKWIIILNLYFMWWYEPLKEKMVYVRIFQFIVLYLFGFLKGHIIMWNSGLSHTEKLLFRIQWKNSETETVVIATGLNGVSMTYFMKLFHENISFLVWLT